MRRTRTAGTKRRRRFRCDGAMAAAAAVAVDLGILDGEAGDGRGFRERKEREVALKRRCVPDSAAGAAVSCPAVQTARMGWLGRQRRDLVAKKNGFACICQIFHEGEEGIFVRF